MPTPINVNLFHYYKPDNSLSADISELEGAGHQIGELLAVKSFKTGNIVNFEYESVRVNQDDEIEYWTYKPVSKNAPITKLTIWND